MQYSDIACCDVKITIPENMFSYIGHIKDTQHIQLK